MWLWSITLILGLWPMYTAGQEVLVTVEQGTLRGRLEVSALGSQYVAFRGVPYARPPLGDLRFQAPQPAVSWDGVRDALEEGRACVQVPSEMVGYEDPGDENCLVLNVYVPANQTGVPVLVWIPGGGFMVGSGTMSAYNPEMMLAEGVAVVTVNYRLGALGFLSTQDEVAPGNAGLKDQREALRWLQLNIAAFGGDPDRVTVGGESAGGSSSSHHLVSPGSAGLFRGLAIQSGESAAPMGIQKKPREKAFLLGEVLGFSTNDSRALLDFLRAQDAAELVAHDSELLTEEEKLRVDRLVWQPVIERDAEGAFVTDWPAHNFKAGRFHRVPVIEGTTSGDGTIVLDKWLGKPYLEDPELLQELNDNFVSAVAPALHLPTAEEREAAALKIRQFYFGDGDITMDDAQAVVDMTTDIYFAEPTDSSVLLVTNYSDAAPLYYYMFDYRGSELDNATFGNNTYGTWHALETYILFLDPNVFLRDPDSPFGKMSKNLIRLWANFVKYGTPSPEGEPIEWRPFDISEKQLLHITEEFEMSHNMNQDRMDFWHQNIPM